MNLRYIQHASLYSETIFPFGPSEIPIYSIYFESAYSDNFPLLKADSTYNKIFFSWKTTLHRPESEITKKRCLSPCPGVDTVVVFTFL